MRGRIPGARIMARATPHMARRCAAASLGRSRRSRPDGPARCASSAANVPCHRLLSLACAMLAAGGGRDQVAEASAQIMRLCARLFLLPLHRSKLLVQHCRRAVLSMVQAFACLLPAQAAERCDALLG
jgi:hypothetical protein